MLRFVLIILACLSLCFLYGDEEQEINQVGIVLKTIDGLHTHSEKIWPGFDPASTPVVLTFENKHIYAIGLSDKTGRWKKIEINGHPILYSDNDEWGFTHTPMNSAFKVGKQSAFVFQLDVMNDPGLPFFVLIHERFHVHQFAHFKEMPTGAYRDHLSVENISFMRLEEILLANFLFKPNEETLKDLAAVATMRRALLSDETRDWEDDQIRMEGLADYTAVRTFQEYPIDQFSALNHVGRALISYSYNREILDVAIKWRNYGVGAALGLALDFLRVDRWKEKVEKEGFSQIALLQSALALSADEIIQRVGEVEAKYGYEGISRSVEWQILDYQTNVKEITQGYQEQTGISVQLGSPEGEHISGGGANRMMLYLADGSTLSVDDTSSASTPSSNWKLQFKSLPYLLQDREGIREFKVPEEAIFTIDKKQFTLAQLKKYREGLPFTQLSWSAQNSTFNCKGLKGIVKIKSGKLVIEFSSQAG